MPSQAQLYIPIHPIDTAPLSTSRQDRIIRTIERTPYQTKLAHTFHSLTLTTARRIKLTNLPTSIRFLNQFHNTIRPAYTKERT